VGALCGSPRRERRPGPPAAADRRPLPIGPNGCKSAIDSGCWQPLKQQLHFAVLFRCQHSTGKCAADTPTSASQPGRSTEQPAELQRQHTAAGQQEQTTVWACPSLQTCPPLAELRNELQHRFRPVTRDDGGTRCCESRVSAVSCRQRCSPRLPKQAPRLWLLRWQHHPTPLSWRPLTRQLAGL